MYFYENKMNDEYFSGMLIKENVIFNSAIKKVYEKHI